MLVDTVRTIWLSVPTFTGAFPSVTSYCCWARHWTAGDTAIAKRHVKNKRVGRRMPEAQRRIRECHGNVVQQDGIGGVNPVRGVDSVKRQDWRRIGGEVDGV